MEKLIRIYALKDKNGSVFYIGATVNHVLNRLAQHIRDARGYGANRRKCEVIKANNYRIFCEILDIIPVKYETKDELLKIVNKHECAWVLKYLDMGVDLTNVKLYTRIRIEDAEKEEIGKTYDL